MQTLNKERKMMNEKDDAKLWFIVILIATVGWMIIAITMQDEIPCWIRLPISFVCGFTLYRQFRKC